MTRYEKDLEEKKEYMTMDSRLYRLGKEAPESSQHMAQPQRGQRPRHQDFVCHPPISSSDGGSGRNETRGEKRKAWDQAPRPVPFQEECLLNPLSDQYLWRDGEVDCIEGFQLHQGQALLRQHQEESMSSRSQTLDRPNTRRHQENTAPVFDVIRQQPSETLNRERLVGGQSQPIQEQTQTLVQQEHDQSSKSEPDQSLITSLAQKFVDAVMYDKAIKNIRISDQEYLGVKKCLEAMKKNGHIDSQIHKKAREKAYSVSDKGKEREKRYRTSDRGKKIIKRYRTSDKGKEAIKRYETSDKRKEKAKRYETSDKGKETKKRYETSDEGKETIKRYKASDKVKEKKHRYETSDKGKETKKRYETSDKGKETAKRYRDKLKTPFQNRERLQKKIQKDTENYRSSMKNLEQQILKHELEFLQETPELQNLLQQKQSLEQEWSTRQKRNQDALQKALALVEVYTQVSARVESFQSISAHQELGQTQQHQAWVLEEEPDAAAFENNECFHEIYNQYLSLLEPSPGISHQQELVPTDPSAVQPSAFERLVTGYHCLNEQLEEYLERDEQLEVYLQEFAHPESLQQGNTLDFYQS
jgi:DNA-binding PadR family transcriptional regulator